MKVRGIMLVAVLALTGAACSSDKSSTPEPSGTVINATDGLKFEPASAAVSVGTVVTWKAGSGVAHNATSDAGSPAAFKVDLPAGGTGSFTFTKAGTYPYYCTIHGKTMSGTVTVS